jgi:hypothetical protein
MDSFKEQFEAFAKAEDVSGLSETIEELGVNVKKLQEQKQPKEELTMKKFLEQDKLKSTYDLIASGEKNARLVFDINMKTNVLRSSVTDHTLAYRLTDVGQQATQATVVANQFRQRGVPANNNGVIRYVDQETVTRNAAMRAEAAQYPESAIEWKEYTQKIEKLADSIPFSHEMITDVDFVEEELRQLMDVNIAILEDNQVVTGTGVSPQLDSLGTRSTANIYDLINSVKVKISNGFEKKYMPNKAIMNPLDFDEMISTKDANDNYVQPPFVVSANGNMVVNGVEIIQSPSVAANTMYVGDFRWGSYYTSENLTVEIGWVNDQFVKDLFTLKAYKRTALLIRNVDQTAFYKVADIDAALANITS